MSTSDTIVVDLLHTQGSDIDQEDDGNHASTRKIQYRWNPSRYIPFLRIVILRSPFAAPYKTIGTAWETVAQDYNLAIKEPNCINGRKAKEKFYSLISTFRKDEAESLRKSGTDEEYTELDRLLEELDELERDSRIKNELNRKKVIYMIFFNFIQFFNIILYRLRRMMQMQRIFVWFLCKVGRIEHAP